MNVISLGFEALVAILVGGLMGFMGLKIGIMLSDISDRFVERRRNRKEKYDSLLEELERIKQQGQDIKELRKELLEENEQLRQTVSVLNDKVKKISKNLEKRLDKI